MYKCSAGKKLEMILKKEIILEEERPPLLDMIMLKIGLINHNLIAIISIIKEFKILQIGLLLIILSAMEQFSLELLPLANHKLVN